MAVPTSPAAWGAPAQAGPVPVPVATALLISDFTIDPLVAALERTTPSLDAELAPFGAVVASLLDPPVDHRDVAVLKTRPELVLSTFRDVLDGLPVEEAALVAEVDRFAAPVRSGLAGLRLRDHSRRGPSPRGGAGRGLLDEPPGRRSRGRLPRGQPAAGDRPLGRQPRTLRPRRGRWISMVGERAHSD